MAIVNCICWLLICFGVLVNRPPWMPAVWYSARSTLPETLCKACVILYVLQQLGVHLDDLESTFLITYLSTTKPLEKLVLIQI